MTSPGGRAERPRRPRRSRFTEDSGALPAWVLEFHDLRLRPLCRKILSRLPARLGYRDASLYLHDAQQGQLTLIEATHDRPAAASVSISDDPHSLMAAAVRSGIPLGSDDAAAEFERRTLKRPPRTVAYADSSCLVAPLSSGGRLVGVLNFSGRAPGAARVGSETRAALLTFLGASLRNAQEFEQARIEARRDGLTGLTNHRGLFEILSKEIRRAQRFGQPLSILLFDLDGLKQINDRDGHAAGDAALRHVAGRIQAGVRETDAAARLGGDEFVAVLTGTDAAGAQHVARRILEDICRAGTLEHNTPIPVSVSVGVAQWIDPQDTCVLLEQADTAMYAAKRAGGGCIVMQAAGGFPVDGRSAGRFQPDASDTADDT